MRHDEARARRGGQPWNGARGSPGGRGQLPRLLVDPGAVSAQARPPLHAGHGGRRSRRRGRPTHRGADAGADHVVNYRDADLAHSVTALTSGVDVVFDAVGGDAATQAIRLLAWGGRYLVVGFASGTIPTFKANRLLLKGVSVIGVRAGEAARMYPIEFQRSIALLLDWASEGLLRPHISHRFTLDDASAALATLSERRVTGRVVITIENQS